MKAFPVLFSTFVPGQNSVLLSLDDVFLFMLCFGDDGSGCEVHSGAMEKTHIPSKPCRIRTAGRKQHEALGKLTGGRHGVCGGNGLGLGLFALGGDQLGPDSVPVVRAKHLSRDFAFRGLLNEDALLDWDGAIACFPFVDRWGLNPCGPGDSRIRAKYLFGEVHRVSVRVHERHYKALPYQLQGIAYTACRNGQ